MKKTPNGVLKINKINYKLLSDFLGRENLIRNKMVL